MNENEPKPLGENVDNLIAAKKVLEDKSAAHGAPVCTISGNLPNPNYSDVGNAPQPLKPNGQHADYYVLCEEERKKGFVRPVRSSYKHIGPKGPQYPIRPLTAEEKQNTSGISEYDYYETYPENEGGAVGRYWKQAELNRAKRGCGVVTSMSLALSETYARDPKFYGATFCCGCGTHYPVAEFVWLDDGTVLGS